MSGGDQVFTQKSALAVTDFNENIINGGGVVSSGGNQGNRSHRTPIPLGRTPNTMRDE